MKKDILCSVYVSLISNFLLPLAVSYDIMDFKFRIFKNSSHLGPSLNTIGLSISKGSRALYCATICVRDARCISFNLKQEECELMGEIIGAGELIQQTGTHFYGNCFTITLADETHFQYDKVAI